MVILVVVDQVPGVLVVVDRVAGTLVHVDRVAGAMRMAVAILVSFGQTSDSSGTFRLCLTTRKSTSC